MPFSSFLIRRISLIRLKICQGVTNTPKQTAKRIFSAAQKAYAHLTYTQKVLRAHQQTAIPISTGNKDSQRKTACPCTALSTCNQSRNSDCDKQGNTKFNGNLTATFLLCESSTPHTTAARTSPHIRSTDLYHKDYKLLQPVYPDDEHIPYSLPPQEMFYEYRIKHLV